MDVNAESDQSDEIEECEEIELIESPLENREISEKIKVGLYQVNLFEDSRKKSEVWETFGQIHVGDNKCLKNKIACQICFTVFNYK